MNTFKSFVCFICVVLGLALASHAWAASGPVINFSDLIAAPNSGWSLESPAKGAVVTIWGRNFGTVRGTSYVSVSGVDLTSDADYAEPWGEAGKPVPFLQRISFWLNNTMPQGPGQITVTVNGVTSDPVDFRIGAGNIYFIDIDAANNGSGTLQSPWDDPKDFLNAMQPGDIGYFRQGLYDEMYNYGKSNIWIKENLSPGTAEQPIAFVAYPGETPVFDSVANGSVNFTRGFKVDVAHITIAKMTVNARSSAIEMGLYGRTVGNDLEGLKEFTGGTGIIYSGSDGAKLFGNTLHGGRTGNRLDHTIYLGGCNPVEGAEAAYNYSYDSNIDRGPHIVVNHQKDRCPAHQYLKSHYIYNNLVDCSVYKSRAIGIYDMSWDVGEANEPEPAYVYNNIINACGQGGYGAMYHHNGHAEFYNNTVYDSQGPGLQIYSKGDTPVISTTVVNNIFVQRDGSTAYVTDDEWFGVTTEDSNLYFGGDDTLISPAATNTVLGDPLFTIDLVNFDVALDPSSPVAGAGSSSVSPVVTDDFLSNPRTPGAGYDIGAIQVTE
ncbi:MAG: hypothetical protein V6Z89_22730 [Desulfobacter sp.]